MLKVRLVYLLAWHGSIAHGADLAGLDPMRA